MNRTKIKRKRWYDSDWVVFLLASLAYFATGIANYYYHGGYVAW